MDACMVIQKLLTRGLDTDDNSMKVTSVAELNGSKSSFPAHDQRSQTKYEIDVGIKCSFSE